MWESTSLSSYRTKPVFSTSVFIHVQLITIHHNSANISSECATHQQQVSEYYNSHIGLKCLAVYCLHVRYTLSCSSNQCICSMIHCSLKWQYGLEIFLNRDRLETALSIGYSEQDTTQHTGSERWYYRDKSFQTWPLLFHHDHNSSSDAVNMPGKDGMETYGPSSELTSLRVRYAQRQRAEKNNVPSLDTPGFREIREGRPDEVEVWRSGDVLVQNSVGKSCGGNRNWGRLLSE